MFKYFDIIFFIIIFCLLIFRSLWYEVARLTNYLLMKILDENKKYKSKSKKNKLERSRLQKFLFRDISIFPYEKEAKATANLVNIILLIVLFFIFFYNIFIAVPDPFLVGLYPMIISIVYSFIFSVLLCWDIFLFLVNKFFILLDKKSNNCKELYIKQNLLKIDIKDKLFNIIKVITFIFIFIFSTNFLYRLTNDLPSKTSSLEYILKKNTGSKSLPREPKLHKYTETQHN